MAKMTLTEYRDELAAALGRSSLNQSPWTRLDLWLKNGLKEVAYAFKFAELQGTGSFTTIDGTNSYDLTAAPISLADFRMLTEEGLRKGAPYDRLGRLIKETRSQYYRKIGDMTDSTLRGNPTHYHRWGKSTIFLRPIPDSTLVTIAFDYWKIATPGSVAGSAFSPLSEDWDDVILCAALYRGFRAGGEHDKYLNARSDFLGLVRSRQLEDDVEEFPQDVLNIVDDIESVANEPAEDMQ